MVAMMGRFCWRVGISRAVASSTCFWRVAIFCSFVRTVLESISAYFTRALSTTAATEPFCLAQRARAAAMSLRSRAALTPATKRAMFPLPLAALRAMPRSTARTITVRKRVWSTGTMKPPLYTVPQRFCG